MKNKNLLTLILALAFLSLLVVSSGLNAASAVAQKGTVNHGVNRNTIQLALSKAENSPVNRPASVSVGCNVSSSGTEVFGDYSTRSGTFFAFDGPGGNSAGIAVCYSDHSSYYVTFSPPGSITTDYFGMAGVQSSTLGLVLAVVNPIGDSGFGGFFFCFGAYASVKTHTQGCAIESTLVNLPYSFCVTMPTGYCYPWGIALDKKLNVYYTDLANDVVVKCTYASGYQTCSVLETLSGGPAGIYLDSKGNIWVTDLSCTGNVWKNGNIVYTLGDSLWGITNSSANPQKTSQLYFGITGNCYYGESFVFDPNDDGAFIISSSPGYVPGISTTLAATSGTSGVIYTLKDTS
jgi:hypothetical protein